MMKKGEYADSYNGDDFLGTFWNSDGSFKSVSEMIDNPQFLYGGLLESRIMTSDVCLESIDYSNLSFSEKRALFFHINKNISFINDNIAILDNLYNDKRISRSLYKDGLKFFKKQISSKEAYRDRIYSKENSPKKRLFRGVKI